MITSPDRGGCALDSGVVCIIVVLNYLGQDIEIPTGVICCHILHYHALTCLIKKLNLTIATWLIWEAGYMFDIQVIK